MNRLPPALLLPLLLLFLLLAGAAGGADATPLTNWSSGNGNWSSKRAWSAGLPDSTREAIIGGNSLVTVPAGDWVSGDLELGKNAGDHVRVEVNGGRLILTQDSLRIGEYTGSDAALTLNRGAVHSAMDVFVGAATATDRRMTHAALTINGGSFLGRTLSIGEGLGAHSSLAINGSDASAVDVLDYVYFLAKADPGGQPAETTLSFTVDAHGVTPITIRSRWDGLRIESDATSHCWLKIALSAVPPADDILLVHGNQPISGEFSAMPEGSPVTADFGGRTYRWTLTYKGGHAGRDLVLTKRLPTVAANDPTATQTRPIPDAPIALWLAHPVFPLAIPTPVPGFVGAEGYGAGTRGGQGGELRLVTNLNDSGPGSLRWAVGGLGPREVRFKVSGVITLLTGLEIVSPAVTIDGGDAPDSGITLRRHGIEVRTHDVILRHFRIRIGDDDVKPGADGVRYEAGDGVDALEFIEGARNCMADHLSLSWSTNKILSTTKMSDLITVQWCILSEALNLSGHGYASITGGNRVTWHHNLFAHNQSRNVRFQGAVDADFRNNVVYDWGSRAAYGEFDRLNYVGNYLKPGPSTRQRPELFHDGEAVVMPGSLYLAGNALSGDRRAWEDNWTATRYYYDRAKLDAVKPFPAPPVKTDVAALAYERVLAEAGDTLPRRDTVDERILREVSNGKGKIVDSVDAAGGWPVERPQVN